MTDNSWLIEFMDKTGFPKEAYDTFINADRLIREKGEYSARIDELSIKHANEDYDGIDEILDALTSLSEDIHVDKYTLHLLFFMYRAFPLRDEYIKRNLPLEVYWDSVTDLRAKLVECKEVKNVWGSFVASWFNGFFIVDRFALGRLQYEMRKYDWDDYSKNGFAVGQGDMVFNVHIPSLGPLTVDSVMDSFKRAYNFFSDKLCGKPIVFQCSSWLLYLPHYDFLPKDSNILKFMDCFDIIRSKDNDVFGDRWRVFGKYTDFKNEDLPEDTSLRRAYKKRLMDGMKTGSGRGIIIFDGEKIVN